MASGITIGRAAAFVGVTVKTIRHYHRLGLVDEPLRDDSGYRRYRSSDLLRLVQVRTLAESGVPLSRIGDLLEADPQRFTSDLAGVRERLTERIEELIERRERLDRLAYGDRLLLPDRACALLERAASLGLPDEAVAAYREGMVLMRALVPDTFDDTLAIAERVLDDARFVDLNRQSWAVKDLDPEDPRIEELATAMADSFLENPELLAVSDLLKGSTDGVGYGLINQHGDYRGRAIAAMTSMVETKLRSAGVEIPHG